MLFSLPTVTVQLNNIKQHFLGDETENSEGLPEDEYDYYYLVPKNSERPEDDPTLIFVLDPCTLTKVFFAKQANF